MSPTPSLGFNGELHEIDGRQILGSYRTYSPTLRRFHSPDNLSPFDKGGVNPYAYAGNDPVNRTDPTGHFLLPLLGGLAALASARFFLTSTRIGLRLRGFSRKPISNIRELDNGLHAFEDSYKGGRRINFDTHGDAWGRPFFAGQNQPVSALVDRAKQSGIRFEDYDSARLLICRSGDYPFQGASRPGNNLNPAENLPVGQQFADATGLRTKAFRGTVAAAFPNSWRGPFDAPGEGTMTLVRNGGFYSVFPDERRHYDPVVFEPRNTVATIRSGAAQQQANPARNRRRK